LPFTKRTRARRLRRTDVDGRAGEPQGGEQRADWKSEQRVIEATKGRFVIADLILASQSDRGVAIVHG
jgi:hypothetical protein